MRRKESSSHWWIATIIVLLVLGGLYYWHFMRAPDPAALSGAPGVAGSAEPDSMPAVPPPGPALPAAPSYPVEPEPEPAGEPAPAAAEAAALPTDAMGIERYFDRHIGQLLAGSPLVGWLHLDDFARRVVATVDNLPSRHVAPLVWPVQPTPGRLALAQQDGQTVLGADNSARYQPLVAAISAVDTARAVALYRQAYPLFQKAYEDLGYPGRYFNDRLVQVIDHLLDTPELPDPVPVLLPEVKPAEGLDNVPAAPLRPWVRYEFADPQLEKLSAGQKLMLRIGAANRAQLQAKLREWRAAITTRAPAGAAG